MGERLVKEITPRDYPHKVTLLGRCGTEGCPEPSRTRASSSELDAVNYLRGWFERHVLETGHSILIVEPEEVGPLRPEGDGRVPPRT